MRARSLFFYQGPAQQVGAAPAHAREAVGHQQNVLLEGHQAVGVTEQRLKRRVRVGDRLEALVAARKGLFLALVGGARGG